ncbi:SMP-30/gluconolactonase/LRE family protein [Loktanella sp. IMCC34160]|uniref:SMP-30/gluconolactonase/LRE family protein n=1 Tax=Loktanella sp. IMCC34160 TaxID=2510646 RepID=UPI00101C28D6|nr:SMP-30/gluconolactonase/LRE family protein [Loktanella sp. IMCC34160]RYG92666.1 SMP-30/gluconolactonase/LRE family protein [Loktanella sp. IMCC34160]
MIYDATNCTLGEGPLWHPERKELFWFDILGKRLHRKGQHWQFDTYVSAAGWVDRDRLMVASARDLFLFNVETGETERSLCPLEADNPVTRSNDGRADPQGGFWIGTMGIKAERGAGAIWRYYRGELRRLFPDITISNAICFAPDGATAYFTDTPTRQIMRVALDADGWPKGTPEVHIDLTRERLNPDGAVVDAAGNLWNAQWGASRVACYDPTGRFQKAVGFDGLQTSCPAFGGDDLTTLFCTTAAEGLNGDAEGRTYAATGHGPGQAEHKVTL